MELSFIIFWNIKMKIWSLVSQQYRAWSDYMDVLAGLALYWRQRLITFSFGRIMVKTKNENNGYVLVISHNYQSSIKFDIHVPVDQLLAYSLTLHTHVWSLDKTFLMLAVHIYYNNISFIFHTKYFMRYYFRIWNWPLWMNKKLESNCKKNKIFIGATLSKKAESMYCYI